MPSPVLPASYRWFLLRGLTDWTPWHLQDDAGCVRAAPDFEKGKFFQKQCRIETGANFDFYLFARRQDQEDFAFFICGPNGEIEDSTFTRHLTFSGRFEHRKGALTRPTGAQVIPFMQWIGTIATDDMKEWIDDFESNPELY